MDQPLPPMQGAGGAKSPRTKPAVAFDISIGAWQGKWSTDIAAIASVSSYVVARYFAAANRIDLVECKNLASSTPAAGDSELASDAEAEYLTRAGTLSVHVAEVGGINLSSCGLRPHQKILSMHSFCIEPHLTGHQNGNDRYRIGKSGGQGGYYAMNPAVLPLGSYLLCLLSDDPSQYIVLGISETNKLHMVGQGRFGSGKDFFSLLKLADGELHGDPSSVRSNEFFRPTHLTVFGFPSAHYGLGYDASSGEYIIISLINLVLAAASQTRQQHPNAPLPMSVTTALAAHSQIAGLGGGSGSPGLTSPFADSHNMRTAVIIQRGYFEAEWSDLMWKGSPNRYSTRQKFFCYNAVTGSCAFECVRVDRRFVLLAEGEEVSFPIAGDKAQLSSDNESDINTANTTPGPVSAPVSLPPNDEGPPLPDIDGSPLPNRASLHTRMEAHRRSIALVGTELQPSRRRGCLLIPVNLSKQVGCLLYSHNYLSVPPTGRSTGVVPRIGYSLRRAGGATLEHATAMLQKRIFAHDEPWSNCVFLTNNTHNTNHPDRLKPSTSGGTSSSMSLTDRSFLMTYSKHSGVVWISQIYQISNKARKGADVALPQLASSSMNSRGMANSVSLLQRHPSGTSQGGQLPSGLRLSGTGGFYSPPPIPAMAPSPTASQFASSGYGGSPRRMSRGNSPLGPAAASQGSPQRKGSASSNGRPGSGKAALEQWRRSPTNARSGKDVRLYDEEEDALTTPYTVTSRYTSTGPDANNSSVAGGRSGGRAGGTKGVGFATDGAEGDDGFVTTTRAGHELLGSSTNGGAPPDDDDQHMVEEYNKRLGGGGGGGAQPAAGDGTHTATHVEATPHTDKENGPETEIDSQPAQPEDESDPNRPAPIKVSLAALLAAAHSGPSTPIPVVTDFSPESAADGKRRKRSNEDESTGKRPSTVAADPVNRHKLKSKPKEDQAEADNSTKSSARPPRISRQNKDEQQTSPTRESPQRRQARPPPQPHNPTKPVGPNFHSGVREGPPPQRGGSPPRGYQRTRPTTSTSDANYDEHGRRLSPERQEAYDSALQQRQKMYSYKVPTLPKSGKMTVPEVLEDSSVGPGEDGKPRFHRKLKSTTPRFTGTTVAQERESSTVASKTEELDTTIPAVYLHGASRPMFSSSGISKSSQRLASLPPTTDDFHADITAIIRYLQDTEQIPPIHKKAIELALEKVDDMEEGDDDGGLMERPEFKYAGVVNQTPWKSAGRIGDTHKGMALPPDRRSELAKFDKMFLKKREEEIPEMTFDEKKMMRLYKPIHTREDFQEQQMKKLMATLKIHRITKDTYDAKDKKDPTAPDPPVSVKKVVDRLGGTDISIRKANMENKIKQKEKAFEKTMGETKTISEDAMKAHVGRMYDESRKIHQQNMEKLIRGRDQREKKEMIGHEQRPLTPRDEKAMAERLIDKSVQRREHERETILKEMDKQAGFGKPVPQLGEEEREALVTRLSTPNRPT